jgi:hypothetical protein
LVNEDVIRDLNPTEVDKLYNDVVSATTSTFHEQIPNPSNKIFLCAFDGRTFEPKEPCIRCQYLYSKWALEGMPDTTEERRKALSGVRAWKMEYHSGRDPPCTYCAETVAAAKLYALYSGSLLLEG